MTKTSKITLFLLFVLVLLPASALAFTTKSNQAVNVGKNETLEGNLYVAGSSIQVDGKINGDLICAGQSVNINGEVAGDVICAASSINVNGKIGGNLRAAASSIVLNGQIGRNLTSAAASLTSSASSSIGWEALFAGANADLYGRIGRDLTGAAAMVNLGGNIGKNVELWLDNKNSSNQASLKLNNGAVIGGKLTYHSNKDAEISSTAKVAGEIKRIEPKVGVNKPSARDASNAWLLFALYSIVAVLIVGLVLTALWEEQVKSLIGNFSTKPQAAFGWGLLFLFIAPLAILLVMITIIGIPLAALAFAAWLIAMGLSKLFVSIFVGQKLLERFWIAKKESLYAAVTVGVIISYIIFNIPFIGWLASLLAMVWGLGAIYLYYKKA